MIYAARCFFSLVLFIMPLVSCKKLAKRERSKEVTVVSIPAGSEITIPSLTMNDVKLRVPAKAEIVSKKQVDKIEPPSLTEQARADAVENIYIGGAILALIGIVLIWRGHGKAAVCAFLGSISAPMLVQFYSSESAVFSLVVFASIALTLFSAWHIMRKRGLVSDS